MTVAPDSGTSSSPGSLTDAIKSLTGDAAGVITALGQSQSEKLKAKAAGTAAQAQQTNAATWAKILPWAIGGLVVVVVLFFFFRRK